MTIYATKAVRGFNRWQRSPTSLCTGFQYSIANIDPSIFQVDDVLLFAPFPSRVTFPGTGSIVIGNSQWDTGAGMIVTAGIFTPDGNELTLLGPTKSGLTILQNDVSPANIEELTDVYGRAVGGVAKVEGTGNNPVNYTPKSALGFKFEAPATTPVAISGNGPFLFAAGYYMGGVAETFEVWEDIKVIVPEAIEGSSIRF